MSHFFCEPDRLGLDLAMAQWSDPWHRPVKIGCNRCDREYDLILVSKELVTDEQCDEMLDRELRRRGWLVSDHLRRDPARRELCPDCVAKGVGHAND